MAQTPRRTVQREGPATSSLHDADATASTTPNPGGGRLLPARRHPSSFPCLRPRCSDDLEPEVAHARPHVMVAVRAPVQKLRLTVLLPPWTQTVGTANRPCHGTPDSRVYIPHVPLGPSAWTDGRALCNCLSAWTDVGRCVWYNNNAWTVMADAGRRRVSPVRSSTGSQRRPSRAVISAQPGRDATPGRRPRSPAGPRRWASARR